MSEDSGEDSGKGLADNDELSATALADLDLPVVAYAIVDQRNGDLWNISIDDRLLEAEFQQMGEYYEMESLVRRSDVLDLIDQRIEDLREDIESVKRGEGQTFTDAAIRIDALNNFREKFFEEAMDC